MTVQQDKVESIFNAALEKQTAVARAAYVVDACRDDVDLRERVQALLHAHEDAGSFLVAATVDSPTESPGEKIGHYKILQEIGEGGFGTVYMAEQEEPVRRKVALKIIKLGMDTKQVIARFEAERQALAMMEHSNIAKVFDAGSTETGRLYFVMELVKGVPITEYCDKNNLNTEARLHLFLDVCSAIQHAHQKGVIHRDIKPSNVMVTLHDGQPVPKVIDFGISKATNQRLTEKTLFTEYHQLIGTPQYMSPEQAEMSGLDIDTRSDLYSLGALLYELLTGTPPFEAKTLQEAGYADIQRIICEVEPPKPSTRLATLMQTDTEVAKHRSVEPQSLAKLIRGDLDWIVMKAMEKDRTRRYETALELMADIRRHLNNEPIIAGPPGVSYRLTKYVRRHRIAVVAGSLVTTALFLGCVLATIGFVDASNQRDEARSARDEANEQRDEAESARDEARHAKEAAEAEAKRSDEIARFLKDILVSTNASDAARLNVDVANVVETAKRVFGDDHATVAATLSSLATQLQGAGRFDEAEPLHREAIRIWRDHHGNDHANVGLALTPLGALLVLKGDHFAAEEVYREALRITQLHGPESVAVADILMGLGDVLASKGDFGASEETFRESLRIRRIVAPEQHLVIALTVNEVANAMVLSGRSNEIENELHEVADAFRKAVPPTSNLMAKVAVQVGMFYGQQRKFAEAERYLREAMDIYRVNEKPSIAYRDIALKNLAQIVDAQDDKTPGYAQKRIDFVEYVREIVGSDHDGMHVLLAQFADELAKTDRLSEAISFAVEALKSLEENEDNGRHIDAANRALRLATRSIAITPKSLAADYAAAKEGVDFALAKAPDNTIMIGTRGMLLYREGKVEDSLPVLSQSLAHLATRGVVDPELLAVIAMAQHRLGKTNEAKATYVRVRARIDPEKEKENKARSALFAEAAALIDGDQSRDE